MNQQNFTFLSFIHPLWSFILIVGLLLFQIFKKRLPSLKILGIIIKIFISVLIIFAIFFSVLNYFAWKQNDISKHLLPPFTPIIYVLHYSWQHYFFASIVTIIFALIVFWGIKSLNKKFNNVFFYDEEPYLAALGILTTGWPNCLIYLSLVLFLGMVFHFVILCFYQIINWKAKRGSLRNAQTAERAGILSEAKKSEAVCASSKIHAGDFGTFSKASPFRLSLLYFWLPSALLVLFLSGIISKYIGITQLSI